jgi:uncharacterized protein YecT (DUF1311 family)
MDATSCQVSFQLSAGKTIPLFKSPTCPEGGDSGITLDSIEKVGSLALPAREGTDEYHLFTVLQTNVGNSGPPSVPFWAVVVRSNGAWATVQPFYEGEELSVGKILAGPAPTLAVSEPATTTDSGVEFTIRFGLASRARLAALPSKVISKIQRTLVGEYFTGFHASNWRPVVRAGNDDTVIDDDGSCALSKADPGTDVGPVRLLAEETKWDDGRTQLKCLSVQAAAPTPTALSVPGAPSAADCTRPAPKSSAPARTQLEINEQQYSAALAEACKMRTAYTTLDKAAASKPGAAEKLLAAQTAWNKFSDAHDGERFPHQDEQGYYGSMLGMCVGAEDEAQYKARTLELRAMQPCEASAAMLGHAQTDAAAAQLALRDTLSKIFAAYKKDPKFLLALRGAEQAFENMRNAQAAYVQAASGGNATCGMLELERVTRARTKQLNVWLNSSTQGDSCSGSYGPP